ncbi:tRNA uridine-5-carboxymethylaminomethyl(34) synthesis GTPase MnmE [Desulfovibrio sp.]|uniref:tRNA uridine-5-carboxymethylaminomethyl(34) synthesis GTPase MnmE n=1 Tax=Desulfovibrio sp. TaxID=885 RepID=UPI0023D4D030|nr:tRNA uridine-5-carboxymethylaminomethyl(34) synthesis GTPase MnmE [Desulfovibrio sp.]MDE7241730.1 tRNA uridine-5-carboxymethylaminomethyl(34) synthesis GTPase MnmE [Desulfovibrio sp.]
MSTIAAIATPPGAGGIGIVRISGPRAKEVLARVFLSLSPDFENFRPWRLHRGRMLDRHGEELDDVLAVFMPGPRTFTGEDMAEIHCHGGPFLLEEALLSVLSLGARQAERGEFSRRAFENGRLDLSQAEAVAELIGAPSREAARLGLGRLDGQLGRQTAALREELDDLRAHAVLGVDFPDDEVPSLAPEDFARAVDSVAASVRRLLAGKRRARLMQEGAQVVIAGAPNAGKSSLLNALLGRDRALVTDIPGTTRDFLEEQCDFGGLPVRLVDTAGLRADEAGADPVESLGMTRARERVAGADLVLVVADGARLGEAGAQAPSCPDAVAAEILELAAAAEVPALLVWNKCDVCAPRPPSWPPAWAEGLPACQVSAATGEHLEELAGLVRARLLEAAPAAEGSLAPNARQAVALERALEELTALAADIRAGQPQDCCLARLDTAAAALGEVTGVGTAAEVLDRVFEHFCIGK